MVPRRVVVYSGVVAEEREKLLTRIAELESALRATTSDDVRATIREAIADCERTLETLEPSARPLVAELAQ